MKNEKIVFYIKELFEQALYETNKPKLNLFALFVLLSKIMLVLAEKSLEARNAPAEAFEPSSCTDYINRVMLYIYEHYNEPWDTKMLANIAFVSPEHLCRNFKKHTGMTIGNYINKIRIEKSLSDLIHTDESIEEILYRHGFNNPKSYYTYFQKMQHMTPMQYRQKARSKNPADIKEAFQI